jgi:hypothetical protein
MNKVIIITIQSYNNKNLKNYFRKDFINEGYEFEYWEVFECFYERSEVNQRMECENVIYFKTFIDLKKTIENIANNMYVFLYLPFGYEYYKILKLISSKSIEVFKLDYNISISNFTQQNKTLKDKIVYFGSFKKIISLIKFKILNYLIEHNSNIKKPKIFITGSNASLGFSLTFDDFIEAKNIEEAPRVIENDYILYLDNYLPHHIDFKINKIKTIDPEIFYKKLDIFFTKIEKTYNLPVVIAYHPKSLYKNEFKGRLGIKNNTSKLVKDSTFVINQFSSAISFAILFKKPILFFYMDEFLNEKSYLNKILRTIEFQSNFFNSKSINIDKNSDFRIPEIDKNKYLEYQNTYLKSSQFPKSNYEIVLKQIKTNEK